jgi:hypothetical protein
MALPLDVTSDAHDPRALTILAKTLYRELRGGGYAASEVMTLASELLELVASEVKDRRDSRPSLEVVEAPASGKRST